MVPMNQEPAKKPYHMANHQNVGTSPYALAWSTIASTDWSCHCGGPREGHDLNPPCAAVSRAKDSVDAVLAIYELERGGWPSAQDYWVGDRHLADRE